MKNSENGEEISPFMGEGGWRRRMNGDPLWVQAERWCKVKCYSIYALFKSPFVSQFPGNVSKDVSPFWPAIKVIYCRRERIPTVDDERLVEWQNIRMSFAQIFEHLSSMPRWNSCWNLTRSNRIVHSTTLSRFAHSRSLRGNLWAGEIYDRLKLKSKSRSRFCCSAVVNGLINFEKLIKRANFIE